MCVLIQASRPGFLRVTLMLLLATAHLLGWGPPTENALGQGIQREHHPWARFEPGAWSKVRVVTETLDGTGSVTDTSVTTTTTTLVAVTDKSYTLRAETTVELRGKRIAVDPQTASYGYHGEDNHGNAVIRENGTATVTVDGNAVPCRVFQVEVIGDDNRQLVTVHYAQTYTPYVLKKETQRTDPSGELVVRTTTEDVVAVNMPRKALSDIVPASLVKLVRRNGKGSTVAWAFQADVVPGGIVDQSSKELDPSGRIVRRSNQELLDYGARSERARARRPRSLVRQQRIQSRRGPSSGSGDSD